MKEKIKCPKCGSTETQKSGFAYQKGMKIQRYLCKKDGTIFLDKENAILL